MDPKVIFKTRYNKNTKYYLEPEAVAFANAIKATKKNVANTPNVTSHTGFYYLFLYRQLPSLTPPTSMSLLLTRTVELQVQVRMTRSRGFC